MLALGLIVAGSLLLIFENARLPLVNGHVLSAARKYVNRGIGNALRATGLLLVAADLVGRTVA